MSKISDIQAQLKKQARPQEVEEPKAKTSPVAKSREGKAHIGAYLSPEFRKSMRMVQAQTDKDMQALIAESLNDLFRKYNVPVVDSE